MLQDPMMEMDSIVFVGSWVKERTLGSGSFGVVVLWRESSTGERLAIKSCRWGAELTDKHRERWSKEVDMLRTCTNDNIVRTRDLPQEFLAGLAPANPSRLPLLCMEYCSGGDLRQILNRVDSSSGLREAAVRQILSDVRNAMEFLYRNKITHRDLKPENVVLKVLGDQDDKEVDLTKTKVVYKLIDLGYAKEIDSKSVCASFVGTLQYLAPELFYSKTYSNSVDFWSFGLLAFEVICGVRPFLPHMAPVQWMPLVKQKSSDDICVFETYHGDVKYSSEVFPENNISTPFKLLIEKWLKVALEYDPKLRGRDAFSKGVKFNLPPESNNRDADTKFGNVIIFSLLQEILSKKIIKIFSLCTLTTLAYEIDDSVLISTLKIWIERDTKVATDNQILISQLSYNDISNDELVVKYWNEQSNVMIYLYHKEKFMTSNVPPKIPKAIQRCLEQPKALYNFKNSKDLYKSALYFVNTEKENYDLLITGCLVKAETLKSEGKMLMLRHNTVDKAIGKLSTMHDILSKMLETSKQNLMNLKEKSSNVEYFDGFQKVFIDADYLMERIAKLQNAWLQLTTRLQSAARRSNEIIPGDLLNNFVIKYNFQNILSDMYKAYINYKKNEKEFRIMEKQCHDVVKISYNCLKIRDKILQEIISQPFVLKMLDISLEFSKIKTIIDTASENTDKLAEEVTASIDELTKCSWDTITFLAGPTDTLNVPYSVMSFEKSMFKIGDPVTNHTNHVGPVSNGCQSSTELKSLVEDSLKIRKSHSQLTAKLNLQKKSFTENEYDFSFLKENIE